MKQYKKKWLNFLLYCLDGVFVAVFLIVGIDYIFGGVFFWNGIYEIKGNLAGIILFGLIASILFLIVIKNHADKLRQSNICKLQHIKEQYIHEESENLIVGYVRSLKKEGTRNFFRIIKIEDDVTGFYENFAKYICVYLVSDDVGKFYDNFNFQPTCNLKKTSEYVDLENHIKKRERLLRYIIVLGMISALFVYINLSNWIKLKYFGENTFVRSLFIALELTLISKYAAKSNKEKNILIIQNNGKKSETFQGIGKCCGIKTISIAKYLKALILILIVCSIVVSIGTFVLLLMKSEIRGIDLRIFVAVLGILLAWNIQILISCQKSWVNR